MSTDSAPDEMAARSYADSTLTSRDPYTHAAIVSAFLAGCDFASKETAEPLPGEALDEEASRARAFERFQKRIEEVRSKETKGARVSPSARIAIRTR